MLYPGFVSGSYESQSPFADLEKTVNWYPEPIEPNSVPWSSALYPCPGFTEYVTVANVNTRALFSMAGRVYAVIGNTVYQVFANNTAVAVTNPTVANNPSPAQIASNGDAGGGTADCLWHQRLPANHLQQYADDHRQPRWQMHNGRHDRRLFSRVRQ
jgi:hypothetical protein